MNKKTKNKINSHCCFWVQTLLFLFSVNNYPWKQSVRRDDFFVCLFFFLFVVNVYIFLKFLFSFMRGTKKKIKILLAFFFVACFTLNWQFCEKSKIFVNVCNSGFRLYVTKFKNKRATREKRFDWSLWRIASNQYACRSGNSEM